MKRITRRSLLGLTGSTIAWAGVRHALSAKFPPQPALNGKPLLTHPVRVPTDFLGMHAHRWPGAAAGSAAPTYAFGAARSHDHDGTAWNEIHRGPDVYAWESLDRWVSAHSAARRTLIYTLYGTPAWLAERTQEPDLYGRPGGASPPRSLEPLSAFIKALNQRYNADGEHRIGFVETWNEPHFDRAEKGFWSGSAEQLVAVGRTCFSAAKSIDARVQVLSPGFVGDLAGRLSLEAPRLGAARSSPVYQYLTAPDGHGQTGTAWCDAIAFHTYNTALSGNNTGSYEDVNRLRALLQLLHVQKPLVNTECGFVAPHPFHNLSAAEQGLCLKRLGVVQAALGVQGLYFYSHDDDFIGNPSAQPHIAQALGELQAALAGATLTEASLHEDGSVRFATEKGLVAW